MEIYQCIYDGKRSVLPMVKQASASLHEAI